MTERSPASRPAALAISRVPARPRTGPVPVGADGVTRAVAGSRVGRSQAELLAGRREAGWVFGRWVPAHERHASDASQPDRQVATWGATDTTSDVRQGRPPVAQIARSRRRR